MATIITHRCAHQTAFEGDADAWADVIAALTEDTCPACRSLVRYRDALAHPLPAVKGSEKQRAWATRLQRALCDRVTAYLRTLPFGEAALVIPYALHLRTITEARWWIDHRDEEPALLLARVERDIVARMMQDSADAAADNREAAGRVPEGQCTLCRAPVTVYDTYEQCTACGYILDYT